MTTVKGCEPNTQAVESICAQIGEEKGKDLTLNTDVEKPVICDYYTDMYIVTTPELLASKLNKKHTQYYATTGQTFQFVGPLMFSSSSTSKQATVAADLSEECVGRLFKRVDDVLAAGQRIAYVSLGKIFELLINNLIL